ncbi:hypothetical protein Tcan_06433 [Toxocara canis]|nr:hypothetical protein Tcan_06433 [Toxocara canis]VDM47962.1 unnamed protein product [Toxocara canis]
MTTVGKRDSTPNGILVTISLFAMSLVSISFVVLEKYIENSVQGFEMAFNRQFASVGRWLNSKTTDNDRIIEEEDEETEDSEYS